MTKTHEDFIRALQKKNSKIEVVGEYAGIKTKTKFKCCLCGHAWLSTPDSILNANTGCPMCVQSHGERDVLYWLKSNAIDFITQYKFNDCKDIEPLPFDFYLPTYNMCIEYDGEQHYMPVNFGGISDECAVDNFKKTKAHDAIKDTYCQQHEINLIRIPYWNKNNINTILNNLVKKYN